MLFGEEDPEKVPKVDGMQFSRANDHRVDLVFEIIRSPLHALTFGLLTKFRLTKTAKKFFALEEKISCYGYDILKKRLESDETRDPNLIDILLKDVKEEKEPKKIKATFDNIVESMLLLYAAGTDTSRSTSTGMLYFLSKYPDVREAVTNDILTNLLGGDWSNLQKNPSIELDWDKCEVVEQFFKELMRIEGIADLVFYRTCTKAHTLGGIKIQKNTIVNYSIYHLHHSEKYYNNPEKFDLSRFDPKN